MREGNRTKLVLWGIFIILAGYLSLKGLSFDKETFGWKIYSGHEYFDRWIVFIY